MGRGPGGALKAGQGPGLVLGGTRHGGHQGIVEFLLGVSTRAMLPPSGAASGQTPEQGPSPLLASPTGSCPPQTASQGRTVDPGSRPLSPSKIAHHHRTGEDGVTGTTMT